MIRVTRDQYNSALINENVALLVEVNTPTQAFLYSGRNFVIGNVSNSFSRARANNPCKLFITDPPSNANDQAGYLLHDYHTR